MIKIKESNRDLLSLEKLIMVQIAIFIVVRIFVSFNTFFIQWDEGKYLTLARNFPFHKLYNHSLYLAHPPLYPYFIKLFSLVLPDYLAGIVLSFLSTVAFIIFFYKLLDFMGLHKKEIFFSVFFITFNWITYYYSHMIYKEVFFLFIVTGTLYLFITGISSKSMVRVMFSGLFASASAFTSDQALLLPLILLAAYLVYVGRDYKNAKYFLPILICIMSLLVWILIKYRVFISNNYYPAGVDGTIENLGNAIGIKQIIFPWFLPNTQKILHFGGFSTSILHYMNEIGTLINVIWPLHITQSLNKTHKIFLLFLAYVPLFLALFTGIIRSFIIAIKKKSIAGNSELFMLIFLFMFLLPLTNKIGIARYAIISIVPIGYFITRGASLIMSKTKLAVRNSTIMILIILELAIFLPLWISKNPHVIFNLKKEVQCQKTGEFLSRAKGDGIMVEFGYSPEIVYLTGKRVIGLPRDPQKLDTFIKLFNIKYLVCAVPYEGKQKNAGTYMRNYIAKSKKYVKIKTVDETYSSVPWGNIVDIYKVSSLVGK